MARELFKFIGEWLRQPFTDYQKKREMVRERKEANRLAYENRPSLPVRDYNEDEITW